MRKKKISLYLLSHVLFCPHEILACDLPKLLFYILVNVREIIGNSKKVSTNFFIA